MKLAKIAVRKRFIKPNSGSILNKVLFFERMKCCDKVDNSTKKNVANRMSVLSKITHAYFMANLNATC